MLFGIPACMFLLVAAATGIGTTDISVFVYLYSLEASSVICKNPSHFNNASIFFVLLKLVLVFLHSFYYTHFILNRYLCPVSSVGAVYYTSLVR